MVRVAASASYAHEPCIAPILIVANGSDFSSVSPGPPDLPLLLLRRNLDRRVMDGMTRQAWQATPPFQTLTSCSVSNRVGVARIHGGCAFFSLCILRKIQRKHRSLE